jgi:hypothetical protein
MKWTTEADAALTRLYPTMTNPAIGKLLGRSERAILGRANKLGLRKPVDFSNEGCFKKGLVPWNKGVAFFAGGASVATQFQPGDRQGAALRLYQPIGTERISKDGYLQRKINDDMPLQRRWRGVHILLWEAVNGPMPKGHALIFKDGDKKNITLENIELITRADLMRRNSFHQYGKEIASVVQLRGAITRQINKQGKHNEQHHPA